MNRVRSEPQHTDVDSGTTDVRELFVTTDFRSMPSAELQPLCGSLTQWLSALLRYKVMQSKSPPSYAIELRRMIKGDAAHVPKRIIKHFHTIQQQLERLDFAPNFYANIPAIGQYSSAIMTMSREDGEIHFCAWQVARKTDQGIEDEGYFGFTTWLNDESSVVTLSPAKLPQPSEGVDCIMERSDEPAVVLKKHRNRLLKIKPLSVSSTDLFERIESENLRQTDDLLCRGVIRPASPGEVTRIRNDMRV
jgi:hypothetical protein